MAEVTYRIILENATGGGGSYSGIALGGGVGGEDGNPSDMGWLKRTYNTVEAIKGFAPVAAVGAIGKQLFSWQLDIVYRNNGNALMKQKIDAGFQLAGQAAAAGGLFVAGIATANPLLLLGAATSAITTAIGYGREYEQYNYERRWEGIGLAYARERAGMSYNKSRMS